MAKNAVGYVRVSTKNQVKEGYSLDYQTEEIRRYCYANDIHLLSIYTDEGISGAKVDEEELTIDREGLQCMLSDIKSLEVDYIIVLNTSRLWRSDLVKVLIHRELKAVGVDIKAIEQENYSIYTNDPNDFLVNGMMELLDQYQRLEIALKLGRGRKKKVKEGGYAGGRAAFGYKVRKGDKILIVDEEQAKVVRRIFEIRHNSPTLSLSEIANRLNIEGYKTAKGKDFTKVQVKRILDREYLYRGYYRYGDIEVKGVHQAII